MAGAAAWQWHTAQTQRAKAENALNAAAVTADHLVYDLAIELRNQPGMPVGLVLNILSRAEAMQRQLAQANATTPTLQHLEATSLEELSHTLIFQGAIASRFWRRRNSSRNDRRAPRSMHMVNELGRDVDFDEQSGRPEATGRTAGRNRAMRFFRFE